MSMTYGSLAASSLRRIFWISRSRRRRTVGYVTPYSAAASLSDPETSRKFLMKVTSSSSRFAIHSGMISTRCPPPSPARFPRGF